MITPVTGAEIGTALRPLAERCGVELGPSVADTLAQYVTALEHWNRSINLTGLKEPQRIVGELVADALPLGPHLPEAPFRLIDVGSGAGLPGLVLAVLRPDAQVLLLEPSQKRVAFLRAMRRELPLPNVEVQAARLEDLVDASGFDVWVSRAVWPVAEWMTRASSLAGEGALVLGQTGADPPELIGCEVVPYEIGGAVRNVVVRRGV